MSQMTDQNAGMSRVAQKEFLRVELLGRGKRGEGLSARLKRCQAKPT
jgi:hypothetical protein